MFSSKSKAAQREAAKAQARETMKQTVTRQASEPLRQAQATTPSIIAEGTVIMGGIKTVGDIQIDGRVEGDLHAASVTLGHAAELIGDLFAEHATVRGHVQGNVFASHASLATGAHVNGNLLCRTFEVETGARLEGNCRHVDDPLTAAQRRPEPSRAQANIMPSATYANERPAAMPSPHNLAAAKPVAAAAGS
jgi:cytoskeletal protein CcmA (bactofilin family)